jgi:hypothetical protein
LSKAAAVRANVASSNFHFGEASCQMSLLKSRRDDVGRPSAPVEAGQHGLLDAERVHQRDDVGGQGRLLAVANRAVRQEAGGPVAADKRHDDPVARRREHRGDIGEAVDVVGPSVQQNDRRSGRGAGFCVANVQQAGVYVPQRAERRAHVRLAHREAPSGVIGRLASGSRARVSRRARESAGSVPWSAASPQRNP